MYAPVTEDKRAITLPASSVVQSYHICIVIYYQGATGADNNLNAFFKLVWKNALRHDPDMTNCLPVEAASKLYSKKMNRTSAMI